MYFDKDGKRVFSSDIHKNEQIFYFDQLNQTPNRLCKGKCIQFKAPKPANGIRYASGQSRCQVCEIFLTEQGVIDNIRCKCCNYRVRNKPRNSLIKEKYYETIKNADENNIEKESDDENWGVEYSTKKQFEEQENNIVKKSTPIYEDVDDSVKTYYEFKEFLDSEIKLQANYQLVMLKELLEYGRLHKGEIADSLAYFNNIDSSDINSVTYYLDVPVYDVLVDHGFVIVDYHNQIPHYTLNVKLTDMQKIELSNYLISNIEKYNREHNIPDNVYPNANNVGSIDWDKYSVLLKNQKPQEQTNENIQQIEENILNEEKFQDDTKKESKMEFKNCSHCNQTKIPIWDSQSVCPYCVKEKEREAKEEKSRTKWMKKFLGFSNVETTITKKPTNESSWITQKSEKIHNDESIVKECPRCHTEISGISNSLDFNNQIEEKFGFRQMDPNDQKSKTPQSYCRDCRSSQNIEKEHEEIDINSDIESQDFKSVKIFESNNDSINIKQCKVISTEIIQKDQQLTNDDLMRIFGVGNMGGIRYSSKNNVIILCDTTSGYYDDKVDKDFQIIYYTGEGRKGDQKLTGGNQRIVNSETTPMFYFIEVPQEPGQRRRGALDNIYKFVGQVTYTKHAFKTENDIDGTPRQIIKFLLGIKK